MHPLDHTERFRDIGLEEILKPKPKLHEGLLSNSILTHDQKEEMLPNLSQLLGRLQDIVLNGLAVVIVDLVRPEPGNEILGLAVVVLIHQGEPGWVLSSHFNQAFSRIKPITAQIQSVSQRPSGNLESQDVKVSSMRVAFMFSVEKLMAILAMEMPWPKKGFLHASITQ